MGQPQTSSKSMVELIEDKFFKNEDAHTTTYEETYTCHQCGNSIQAGNSVIDDIKMSNSFLHHIKYHSFGECDFDNQLIAYIKHGIKPKNPVSYDFHL